MRILFSVGSVGAALLFGLAVGEGYAFVLNAIWVYSRWPIVNFQIWVCWGPGAEPLAINPNLQSFTITYMKEQDDAGERFLLVAKKATFIEKNCRKY